VAEKREVGDSEVQGLRTGFIEGSTGKWLKKNSGSIRKEASSDVADSLSSF